MLGKAERTIEAQNPNLQSCTGVPLVKSPLCWLWLVIKEWLRETAGMGSFAVCEASGHALKQESEFKR